MNCIKALSLAVLACLLTACVYYHDEPEVGEPVTNVLPPVYQDVIALENLKTHTMAYCYASAEFSAERCAEELEKNGYVKVSDIPQVPASHDFLTTGTYPTRRWRENDVVPRW